MADLLSEDHAGRKRHDRDPRHLADVRNGTAGARIDLDDVDILILDDELNVHHTDHMKVPGKQFGVGNDRLLHFVGQIRCRIHGDRISAVDACALDMFHDARDQDVGAVAHCIHFDLLAGHVFVDQDRMFLGVAVDLADILIDILVRDGDPHAGSAQNVRRPDKYRISQTSSYLLGFLGGEDCIALRPADTASAQYLIKTLTILRSVHVVRIRSEDRNAHFHECFRQFDRSLATELDYSAVRFLCAHYVLHILRSQRLEIKPVRNIKVRGDGLRVVVDNDGLIPCLLECPGTVYGAEVEFDSLSDPDRARTQDEHLRGLTPFSRGLTPGLPCLICSVID